MIDVATNLPLQVSGSLTVDRSFLTLTNSAVRSVGLLVDHGGSLNITNSLVSESGVLSTFDINNGSAWLDSGLLDCSGISAVRIGRTNNASGSLTINGGTLLAPQIALASSTAASGTLTVAGGVVNASLPVTVGYGVNSTGTLLISGGQFIATNDITYVGKGGFGQMTVSGGSTALAFLSVGNNANGQLSMTGGQLIMKPRNTNDWLQIGNTGVGQLNLSGGTVLALGELHVGDDSSGLNTGSGTALLTGGQLFATNDTTAIGRYGPGQMTVSNSLVILTNVSVGRHDGAVGTLTIQSNAQVYLLDALSIGRFSNSVGHVFSQGGLLSLTNDNIWVGREGSGDMTLSGGLVQAVSTFVALSTVVTDTVTQASVTNVPSGTLNITAGSLVLSSNMLVGSSSISTGQVFVTGGNLSIRDNTGTAYLLVSSGTFAMSRGNVVADNLLLTNTTGQFLFNAGTLQAKNALVANGTPFVVGDGVNPASLILLGGVYTFADGLIISNNASVTGCGTIIGNISNYGTLATNCAPAAVTISKLTKTGSTATLFFNTLSGSNHVLEYKNSLMDTSWTAILPGIVGNGGTTNHADTNATAPSRFYRIHLE
jgi:hypothetical protein